MPRRRMVDPDIWFNEKFTSLPDGGRLLFIGIFSNADDDGRLKAAPKYLKAHIFPYDEERSIDEILAWRNLCEEAGLIKVYSRNGADYISLPGWLEHQIIRKDTYHASNLPSPNPQMPLGNTTVTKPLQGCDVTVTPPLPNQSNQSSQVKSNQSSLIEFKDVIENEQDLTDRLTDFLTEYMPRAGGRTQVLSILKNTLWTQAGLIPMSTGVFDVLYEGLNTDKYSIAVMARAIAKAVKYADGKRSPARYIQKILEDQREA